MAQGGDIVNNDGSGGDSIYGGPFDDENFTLTHDEEGMVGMANHGPNTNISQFYITTVPCLHLNGRNVVFGTVRKGLNIIREMSNVPRNEDEPLIKCVIEDCGEIKPGEDFNINENDETEDIYPPWPDDWDYAEDADLEEVISNIKTSGNHYYNNKNYTESDRKYIKVLRYIEWAKTNKIKHDCEIVKNMKVHTLLNVAAVRLKKHQYSDVVNICSTVLEINPKHSKALYRRGEARLLLKEYDKALVDLEAAKKLVPNDIKIQKLYLSAKQSKLLYLKKERLLCAKMFQ